MSPDPNLIRTEAGARQWRYSALTRMAAATGCTSVVCSTALFFFTLSPMQYASHVYVAARMAAATGCTSVVCNTVFFFCTLSPVQYASHVYEAARMAAATGCISVVCDIFSESVVPSSSI